MNYVELRQHTEFSIGHACGTLEDHARRVVAAGSDVLCITEIDTLRHVYGVYKACQGVEGVRLVFGTELSVVADHRQHGLTEEQRATASEGAKNKREANKAITRAERAHGFDTPTRVALRAMNDDGLRNLFALSSKAWSAGFYRFPRFDFELLEEHSDGLLMTVGGVDSAIGRDFVRGEFGQMARTAARLREVMGDRLYFEIHPHSGVHRGLNRAMMLMAERLDIPLVAVNDVRYVLADDVDAHTVVLCLGSPIRGMTLEDPSHPRSTPGYHVRTGDEMIEAFGVHHPDIPADVVAAAVERTVEVADRCHAELDVDPYRALVPDTGGFETTAFVEVKRLCLEGWSHRDIPGRAGRLEKDVGEYVAQLRHELEVIQGMNFAPYFLFVRDVIEWARSVGIMIGPGRGSAAGSLLCYLLGITSVDPLEHDLMFERFLAPGRVDMPDIDVDFQQSRREEVVRYIEQKYGEDRVAHIATFGRMHGKGALKDVCRVVGLPFGEVNKITSTFSNKQGDEKRGVRTVLEGSKTGRAFMDEHPDVMDLIDRLEGSVRLIGVHPAGVVASPVPIWMYCPVETHKLKGETTRITAVDMRGAEQFGLLKIDALGLKNLDVLADVAAAIGEDNQFFETLTFDDQKVIDSFTRQEFVGVFQFDAQSARNVCRDLTFEGFRDVSALTALNRPGCTRSGLTDKFRARRMDPSKIKPFHPIVDAITDDTLGVLVYQEQVIKLFRELAGFDAAGADKIRKKIGKKLGLDDEAEKFVAGAMEHGMDRDDAEGLMSSILKFGEYAFNRAHSCAYAAIGYWQMWCKVYHPREFIWALMRNAKDRDEAMGYVKEARRLGVVILPPDVNESGGRWTLVDGGIRAGLGDIKHVGKTAVAAIEAAQPFTSISDFMVRVPGRAATSRVIGMLIRAGAIRTLLPNTKWALEHDGEWFGKARKRKATWDDERKAEWDLSIDTAALASADLEDYSDEDLLSLALEASPQGSGRHPLELYEGLMKDGGLLAGVPWTDIGDPKFWKQKSAFIRGAVVQIRFRQIGDFGTAPKTEAERKVKQWGRQFAVVHIEDEEGNARRVKIEPDTFDRFRDVVEAAGAGTCLAMNVTLLAQYHSARANFVIDLEAVRQKNRLNVPLNGWELCFTNHPVLQHSRKSITRRRGNRFEATVLITAVRTILDRNGGTMSFFGIQDGHSNSAEVVAFASVYEQHGDLIEAGSIVSLSLRKDRGSFVLTDEGITEQIRRI